MQASCSLVGLSIGLFKVAQVMEAVSVAGIFCTLAGCGMLALRRYSSPTASLSVAAMATGAGM